MYNQGLFSSWVPKLVQLLLIIIFITVIVPVSGIYAGVVTYMVGDTGIQSEYFIWANYAGIIGMSAAMPLLLRFKFRFKIRDKTMIVFLLLALLSYVNGTTDNPYIIVANSVIIGFAKMLIMIEFIIPIMMMITPEGNRGKFYSVFYPFSIALSQVAGYLLTVMAFDHNWQYIHIYSAAVCLVMALLAWIFMHDKYFGFIQRLYYIDWISIVLFVAVFMSGAYVFSFGKQQDWLQSQTIINASIFSFISFVLLFLRQLTIKRPYLSFSVFKRANVIHGLIMLLFLGMCLATGSIQSIFTSGILKYSAVTNASLNLMMIPGIVAAGIYMSYWFKKERGLKMFIFLGFAAMLANTVILYFSMAMELDFSAWVLPMFLKGFGMGALFISVWYYALDNISMDEMLPVAALALVWRTFFTVGISSALFGWLQYQFQIQAIGDMAVYLDGNAFSTNQVMGNLKAIQLNAILAANKKLLGYICIVGIGILLYILSYDFGVKRFKLLPIVPLNKRRYSSRYRNRLRKRQVTQIEDAAGAVI